MFITKVKRVFRAGVTNFWRNGFVSLSSLVVMFIALFIITSLIFMSAILNYSLNEIRDKVDINVYFTSKAKEADIFSLKNESLCFLSLQDNSFNTDTQYYVKNNICGG